MPTIGSFIHNNKAIRYEKRGATEVPPLSETPVNTPPTGVPVNGDWWTPFAQSVKNGVTNIISDLGAEAADTVIPGIAPNSVDAYNTSRNLKLTPTSYYRTAMGTNSDGSPIFNYNLNNRDQSHSMVNALSGLLEFANQDSIADGVVYNLQKIPMEQRESSPFIQQIRQLSGLSRQFGDTAGANTLDSAADSLIKGVGTYGKNLLNATQIARQAQMQMRAGIEKTEKTLNSVPNSAFKQIFNKAKNQYAATASNPEYTNALNNYKSNYLQSNVYSKEPENSVYGMLNSPGARGAFQGALPWLAYGVPAAAIASLGAKNDSLWPLILGGAALFGGLGYAKGNGMLGDWGNGKLMNTIGDFTSFANSPFRSIINKNLPGSENITNELFGPASRNANNQAKIPDAPIAPTTNDNVIDVTAKSPTQQAVYPGYAYGTFGSETAPAPDSYAAPDSSNISSNTRIAGTQQAANTQDKTVAPQNTGTPLQKPVSPVTPPTNNLKQQTAAGPSVKPVAPQATSVSYTSNFGRPFMPTTRMS